MPAKETDVSIYEDLNIEPIINAGGTLTTLGGSLMLPEIVEAMKEASRAFVPMHELHLAVGRRIAELTGVEAAHVCAGAAAGIALMAAACMAGPDGEKIRRLPDTTGMPSTFVVHRNHRHGYDQALRVAGGTLHEIEADADELERAVRTPGVAGVFYTFAWNLHGEVLPLTQVAEIAHRTKVPARNGVPVLVDAAAEVPPVENLWRFVKEGADLVTFSGGKALRGPQSTGLLLGRADLIEACRLNDCPNHSIGRSMKVGKEDIAGLLKAVELYVARDHIAEGLVWDRRVARVLETLQGLPGVQAQRQMPYGVGQQIPHAAITWDEAALGITCEELRQRLLEGQPRIAVQVVDARRYPRGGFAAAEVRVHPHTLREGEEVVVAERIQEILRETAKGRA
jgi:D-glucosaminate-6-phosphate ammonia-lyase